MKIALISFSRNGAALSKKIADFLGPVGCQSIRRELPVTGPVGEDRHDVTVAVKSVYVEGSIEESVKDWTAEQFEKQDAIIFVGAVAIAVRSIAPMAASKCKDPAVLVIDEKGNYCIPILSGHIGGANALAKMISEAFSMEAVITTATDIQGKWAVDVFAVKNHLQIEDLKKAKEISAKILAGEQIRYYVENGIQVKGKVPEEILLVEDRQAEAEAPDIYTGIYQCPQWNKTLFLIPKSVVMGIGCKKGTPLENIEQAVAQALQAAGICQKAIKAVASIDLKAEEQGLLDYCEKYHLEFYTYTSEELEAVEGTFTGSAFVKKITGVDNICERSALCALEDGKLLSKKYTQNGVTVAFAMGKWEVAFE